MYYYLIIGNVTLVPVEVVPVENVEVDLVFFESSGSGLTETQHYNPATSLGTSGADVTDFQNFTSQSVGQLYAYYYSNTSVVLGTWSARYSQRFDLAIGLSATTDEQYVCEAENFPQRNESGISRINVNVKALKR